jgi:hypothetical protein
MAIVYNKIDFRGVAAEPIVEELLFENNTVSQDLVTFEDDVKAETIFTETSATAVLQAYTCGLPTSAGSLDAFDTVKTPQKGMFYQDFCPDNLRFSRFKRDMKPGAWESMSDEFERVVIGGVYAKKISLGLEDAFWRNIQTSTKSAIAGLTAGTAQTSVSTQEKAMANLLPTATGMPFDGILATMLYNDSNPTTTIGVGGRIKVVGTAITPANIKTEYEKLYASIPSEVLNGTEQPTIYAPRSHKQFINIANNVTTDFKNAFSVNENYTEYYYNAVRIVFVPLPENTMIAALKSHIIWITDLLADYNQMKIDYVANNQDNMFIKSVISIGSHVVNQRFNVLYVG